MANIQQEIKNIKDNIKKLKDVNDERLLPLVAYKYIYLSDPEELSFSHYRDIIVDGPNDGGIDAIFSHPEEDNKLIILQSKYYKEITTKDTLLNAFRKIAATIKDLKNQQTETYKKELRHAWANEYDEDKVIEVVFLTSADISDSVISNVKSILAKEDAPFQIQIYTKIELERIIDNSNNLEPWVKNGYLEIDSKSNTCKCPNNENGIIINVTAKSLKNLYEKNDFKLFQQNFRYYIKEKKIDDKIINTIRKDGNLFWFLNNGIIIACSDYWFNGNNKLELEQFSIINGCQTTSLIGDNDFTEDFYLTCKVVKSEESNYDEFVSKIAEASNRQKAIKSRDLKSTEKSMIHLKKQLEEEPNPIFLEIRRGCKISKNIKKVKNDLYGQLILSFFLQQPAKARNSSKTMFEIDSLYNSIFRRKNFDKDTIVDVLDIYNSFTAYKNKKIENEDFKRMPDSETMIKYIHFFVLAIIGLLVKKKRNLIDIKKWKETYQEDNIKGSFINKDIVKYDSTLESFFNSVLYDLTKLFEDNKTKIGTEANFTKVSGYYPDIVIPFILERFFEDPYYAEERKGLLNLFK